MSGVGWSQVDSPNLAVINFVGCGLMRSVWFDGKCVVN